MADPEPSTAIPLTDISRHRVSFSQAEGRVPLPSQLAFREVSPELVAKLWAAIHGNLEKTQRFNSMGQNTIGSFWEQVLWSWHVEFQYQFADEYDTSFRHWEKRLKLIFASRDYLQIFDFVQFVARFSSTTSDLYRRISEAFTSSRAAYTLIDGTIFPKASELEGEVLVDAFETLKGGKLAGARRHLLASAELLGKADFAGSVRESISAIEGVVLAIDTSTDKLGAALSNLEKKGAIHGSLKAAFGSLYGYTSDSEGIRHALVFQDVPHVDEADALFMLGACASFITYVTTKANLLENE